MPELPEVETTLRGIEPYVTGKRVVQVIVRDGRLRWPVPAGFAQALTGRTITSAQRRAKYLLLRTDQGTVIMHLGMSGSLRIAPASTPAQTHDHIDIVFEDGIALRLRDPRRFGCVLWTRKDPLAHVRLKDLGPEPLDSAQFNGEYLHQRSRNRKQAIKTFIMDSRIVVGVGNIYASESLFLAGIHPSRPAGRISLSRYRRLAESIQKVLKASIEAGGTTLRDFLDSDGQPGYFAQQLRVYGKTGQQCPACGDPIRQLTLGQRSTYYCANCQR